MNLEEMWRRGKAGYEDARYQFIITELELTMTFASMALASNDSETKRRNINHAHQAYDAATSRIDKNGLDPERKENLESKLREVNQMLRKLPFF